MALRRVLEVRDALPGLVPDGDVADRRGRAAPAGRTGGAQGACSCCASAHDATGCVPTPAGAVGRVLSRAARGLLDPEHETRSRP